MTEQQAKEKLVSWAAAQVGYHEGEDNWNKYASDPQLAKLYGWVPQNQPWCDVFTDEAFIQCFGLDAASAMTYQPIGRGSALCKTSAQYFKDAGAFYQSPQKGDVIFFFVGGEINHQGLVESVSGGIVRTIEGNSGDKVSRQAYSRQAYSLGTSIIAGYGRPKWAVVTKEEPKPEPAGPTCTVALPVLQRGDTGETVRSLQILLIGRDYSCGGYGADGDFGPATQQAVRNWQTTHRLAVDGVAGQQTWKTLLEVI